MPGPKTRGAAGLLAFALAAVGSPSRPASAAESPFAFRNVIVGSGLHAHTKGSMAHAAGWGDVNGDGWIDLFVGTFADRPLGHYLEGGAAGPVPNQLFLNGTDRTDRSSRGPGFVKSEQESIAWLGRASGVAMVDLDNDGDVDLYVANNGKLGKDNLLYRNDGAGDAGGVRMTLVTDRARAPMHRPEFARGVGVLDFDGDGMLDLLVLSTPGAGRRTMLFRNLGDMRFEVSDAIPGDAYGLGMAAGDLTGNGWPDVMIGGTNRMFVGLGDGTFREAKELSLDWGFLERGAGEGNAPSCGVAFGDFDGDGRADMLIGSHFKRPWREPNRIRLFRNMGSTVERVRFREVTDEVGLVAIPMKVPHVEIRDFDNDGRPDLYTAVVTYRDGKVFPAIFRNLGPPEDEEGGLPRFVETAFVHRQDFPAEEDLPPGRTKVFYDTLVARKKTMYFAPGPSGDFDNDGRLDLYLPNWFPKQPHLLLRNETKGGHWLDVKVAGSGGLNPHGIGAVVRAYRAGRAGDPEALVYSEEIATSYGTYSAQPPVAHLGLGEATAVDVVLALPFGRGKILRRNVGADQVLVVRP